MFSRFSAGADVSQDQALRALLFTALTLGLYLYADTSTADIGYPAPTHIMDSRFVPDQNFCTDSSIRTGYSLGGSFISRDNSILFVEGVSQNELYSVLSQTVWGGLLPGLILGSRPFVSHWLRVHTAQFSDIPWLTYWMMTAGGYIPYISAKAHNTMNVINAGMWYAIPSFFSEGIGLYDRMSSAPTPKGTGLAARVIGSVVGLMFTRLHAMLSGATPRQITLPGDDGRHLFIQLRSNFTAARQTAIEIHRIRINDAQPPNPHTPLGPLAIAMDQSGSDILFLIPQTTPEGNRLNLAFANNKNEEDDLQIHLSNIDLSLANNRYIPWLETVLSEPGWFGSSSLLPNDNYLSIFQQDIINTIAESLPCLTRSQCSTGLVQSSPNSAYITYISHKNRITQTVSPQVSTSIWRSSILVNLSEDMYLHDTAGSLSLAPVTQRQNPIRQYWIPSWVSSFIVAEITAALRDAAMNIPQQALYQLARKQDLSTPPPANGLAQRREERNERDRRNNAQGRQAQRIASSNANLYDNQAPIYKPPAQQHGTGNPPIEDDGNYDYLQEPLENDRERYDRRYSIRRAKAQWEPGKVELVEQGLRKEGMSSNEKDLDDLKRTKSRMNNPMAPVSFATFEFARTDITQGKRVTVNEHYEAPLYAGGVIDNLLPADLPACWACADDARTDPLFKCSREDCTGNAGMHLDCLDKHYRHYVRTVGKTDHNIGVRKLNMSAPCPSCTRPINGEAKWFTQHDVDWHLGTALQK